MPRIAPQDLIRLIPPALHPVFDFVEQAGGEVRVVGGAVRDLLAGRPIGDIDLAVSLPVEKMTALCAEKGVKFAPTGLAHGTVTLVLAGVGYEITSLRRDEATDGRHAEIAYTSSWEEDAARRDFTVNALFVDKEGEIHDFQGGVKDLQEGVLRFIGNPAKRIAEDRLRLLRLFRFYAQFEKDGRPFTPEAQGLKAAQEAADQLSLLSAERIGHEMKALLCGRFAFESCVLMKELRIMDCLIPRAETGALHRLGAFIKEDPILSLACLMRGSALTAEDATRRFALSKAERTKLQNLLSLSTQDVLTPHNLRRFVYWNGASLARLAFLRDGRDMEAKAAADLVLPDFPLTGRDLIDLGFRQGPGMGDVLRAVEEWWVENDFSPSQADCIAKARSLKECPAEG